MCTGKSRHCIFVHFKEISGDAMIPLGKVYFLFTPLVIAVCFIHISGYSDLIFSR